MAVIELSVDQMIVFNQDETRSNPSAHYAANSIAFADRAKNYRIAESARSRLDLGQEARARKSVNHLSASSRLEMRDGGHRSAGREDVVHYLTIGSLARTVEYESVGQSLSIGQAAAADRCLAARGTLALGQVAAAALVRARSVTQTLAVRSGGTALVEDEDRYSIALPSLGGPNAPECP